MADEIGGLSVRLDANGTGLDAVLARGEQRVRVFADRTTAALDNPIFNSAGAAAARRIADALESEFQARSARIQEAVRQGLMSPEEAQEAGRDIAREFNKGLIGGVQALGQQTDPGNLALMGVRLKEVGRSARLAADGVKKAGAAAGGSGLNFKRLTGSLTSVAASVLPVHGGVLRLSTVLSSMALSGGITVGVIAGATAIAGVWNLMTRRARELRTAADEAATAVRDMFLEEQTQGDIRLINLMDDLGAQVDELARKLRELPPEGQGDVVTEAFRTATQKQIDELIRRRDEAQALLDKRRALRREEDRKADQEAADDAKRAAQERLEALTALVAAGRATAAETDELRRAQAALLETMRDGTQSVNDRAAAMENLTRVTEALTQAQLRQIRLADIGPRGRAGIPGVPTARGNLLPAPRTVAPLGVTLATAPSGGGGFGNLLDTITGQFQAQLAGLPQQMLLSMFGQLQGMLFAGVGQLFRGLFGGDRRHASADTIDRLREAAERQKEAAEELRKAASDLRNVPLTFNSEFARTQIGRTIAAGGSVSVGVVNIHASPTGDTPRSLYSKFKQGLTDAASGGDVLARGLLAAGARG